MVEVLEFIAKRCIKENGLFQSEHLGVKYCPLASYLDFECPFLGWAEVYIGEDIMDRRYVCALKCDK